MTVLTAAATPAPAVLPRTVGVGAETPLLSATTAFRMPPTAELPAPEAAAQTPAALLPTRPRSSLPSSAELPQPLDLGGQLLALLQLLIPASAPQPSSTPLAEDADALPDGSATASAAAGEAAAAAGQPPWLALPVALLPTPLAAAASALPQAPASGSPQGGSTLSQLPQLPPLPPAAAATDQSAPPPPATPAAASPTFPAAVIDAAEEPAAVDTTAAPAPAPPTVVATSQVASTDPVTAVGILPPLPATAPLPAATATAPPPPTFQLAAADLPLRLGDQLQWLLAGDTQEVRLQLHPREFGHISVQIRVEGQGVQVAFVAEHPAARAALEQALPQLRERFLADGLQLLDAEVGGGQGQAHAPPQVPDAGHRSEPAQDEGEPPLPPGVRQRVGLIDQYA